MFRLRNISINRRVAISIFLTWSATVTVACAALFVFQVISFRESLNLDLKALAEIMANNSTATITFGDEKGAREILSALVAKPHIKFGYIRLNDGSLFARYTVADQTATVRRGEFPRKLLFRDEVVEHSEPIILEGEQIGTLFLQSDYQSIYGNLLRLYSWIVLLVVTLSVVLALILYKQLQRNISAPILKLANTAKIVAEKKDYSIRATKLHQDEIGQFADAFNSMLAQVQSQDDAIRESEGRYRTLFEESPVSLWEEDFSEVKTCIDRIRDDGITDFRAYFRENPEALNYCVSNIRVVDVNQATVELYRATSKRDLLDGINSIVVDESMEIIREELGALAEGNTHFESEVTGKRLNGETIHNVIRLSLAPGYEDT